MSPGSNEAKSECLTVKTSWKEPIMGVSRYISVGALTKRAAIWLVALLLLISSLAVSGCAVGKSADSPSSTEIAGQAEMSATVVLNACDGVEAQQCSVVLPEGATAFDALEASGIEFTAEDSEYGVYVTSVAGVEASGMSGWVYTLNGEDVFEGCDSLVLSDGDSVEWSFVTW